MLYYKNLVPKTITLYWSIKNYTKPWTTFRGKENINTWAEVKKAKAELTHIACSKQYHTLTLIALFAQTPENKTTINMFSNPLCKMQINFPILVNKLIMFMKINAVSITQYIDIFVEKDFWYGLYQINWISPVRIKLYINV